MTTDIHHQRFATRGTSVSAAAAAALPHVPVRLPAIVLPLLLGLVLVLSTPTAVSGAVPLQYKIPQRGQECLYEELTKDESVTLSVFITSGAELKGTAIIEGPVAPPDTATGLDLKTKIGDYGQGTRYGDGPSGRNGNLRDEITIDFESDVDWDDDDVDDDDDEAGGGRRGPKDDSKDSADDDDEFDDDYMDDDREIPASGSDKSARDRAEERNKRLEIKRRKYEERRAARIRRHQRASEGDALSKTYRAQAAGWYRACVKASWYQITAEIELRKESTLGGIDKRTGHVMTYERRMMLDEEKELDDVNAEQGLKDEDLKRTNEQLRRLNRLLKEIREYQSSERHRLSIHASTNEHSHSRMVLSSLLETVLFMLITGFQVYTIRKWFSGSPMLGR